MSLKRELVVFVGVGASAALVHLLIVWLLVNLDVLSPLQANIAGFLGAVNVSYFGHSQFTFNLAKRPCIKSFAKFFSIAVLSFVINQTAYYYGLKWFGYQFYLPILTVVLVVVAVFTFIFSKFWAFATHESN
ncbi:GtrA-like protein [mine drainage metagenome]|uniref:GtrA-like protein n=1 Tax=mine drainage metagenome TaxID=410659 RepID=A0A1J5TN92_9ZZZZ